MSQYFSRRPWREYGLFPTSSSSDPLSLPSLLNSPSLDGSLEKPRAQCASRNLSFSLFRLPKRYTRLIIATLISLGVLCILDFDVLSSAISFNRQQAEGLAIPYPAVQDVPPPEGKNGLPPLYDAYHEYEDLLSEEHILGQNATENGMRYGRYVFFANHAHTSGWGNVLQEMLFSALLADKASLGYVWDDYTWDPSAGKYADFNGGKITSRKPMSTMLAGHILGLGSPSPNAPRAISSRIYSHICPEHERVYIDRDVVKDYLRSLGRPPDIIEEGDGTEVMKAWLEVLGTEKFREARCIEVTRSSYHIFDIWLFGSQRVQSLWGHISDSPVLTNLDWSPLIYRSFLKNIRFFAADKDFQPRISLLKRFWYFLWPSSSPSSSSPSTIASLSSERITARDLADLTSTDPLPVLVLHLRRGDFEEHCMNLAEWSSTYTGFNSFPESRVRDVFDVPQIVSPLPEASVSSSEAESQEEAESGIDMDNIRRRSALDPTTVASMDERKQVYGKHCYPSTQQIVQRVREVVTDYAEGGKTGGGWVSWWSKKGGNQKAKTKLKKIYVMTNGHPAWAEEVKRALTADADSLAHPELGIQEEDDAEDFEWKWEGISTSRDLDLGWEEQPISQALDMYVASRAEVFVGNGFSSLTSNIVMLRMKMGLDAVQTRFW